MLCLEGFEVSEVVPRRRPEPKHVDQTLAYIASLYIVLRSVFSQPLLARFPPKEKKLCIVGEHEHGDPKSYFQNDPQNFSFFSPDGCAAPCVRGTPLPLYIGSVPPPGVQAAEAAARTRNQTASTLAIRVSFELAQNRFEITLSFPHTTCLDSVPGWFHCNYCIVISGTKRKYCWKQYDHCNRYGSFSN